MASADSIAWSIHHLGNRYEVKAGQLTYDSTWSPKIQCNVTLRNYDVGLRRGFSPHDPRTMQPLQLVMEHSAGTGKTLTDLTDLWSGKTLAQASFADIPREWAEGYVQDPNVLANQSPALNPPELQSLRLFVRNTKLDRIKEEFTLQLASIEAALMTRYNLSTAPWMPSFHPSIGRFTVNGIFRQVLTTLGYSSVQVKGGPAWQTGSTEYAIYDYDVPAWEVGQSAYDYLDSIRALVQNLRWTIDPPTGRIILDHTVLPVANALTPLLRAGEVIEDTTSETLDAGNDSMQYADALILEFETKSSTDDNWIQRRHIAIAPGMSWAECRKVVTLRWPRGKSLGGDGWIETVRRVARKELESRMRARSTRRWSVPTTRTDLRDALGVAAATLTYPVGTTEFTRYESELV